jgi:hypothetical protein
MTAEQQGASAFLAALDKGEKIILGGAALGLLLCFLPWHSVSIEGAGEMKEFFEDQGGGSKSGIGMWQGVVVFLCGLAGAGSLWAEKRGILRTDPKTARLIPLAACGGGALFSLVYVAGADSTKHPLIPMSAGPTIWPWVALIAFAAAAFFAFKRWSAVAAPPVPPPPPA